MSEVVDGPFLVPLSRRNGAPTIETERLVLRNPLLGDFVSLCQLWADPRYCTPIPTEPRAPNEIWLRLLFKIGLWNALGYGFWTVIEKNSEEFVGEVGFTASIRDGGFLRHPEMGWGVAPKYWGKGLAREASTAALGWYEQEICSICYAVISTNNSPSLKLASQLGFQTQGKSGELSYLIRKINDRHSEFDVRLTVLKE